MMMKSNMPPLLLAGLVALALSAGTYAQVSTLDPVTVTATRVDKTLEEIPAAVSRVGEDEIQLGAEQLGLDESLDRVPGLFLLNRYNFAQDLRASIRGFGARSSFGIRGIRIVVDGIPETLPDGQGSVDGIDLGSIGEINVIRGPVSSLYGNASGGAILIESERGPEEPFAELRSSGGEFGFRKQQLKLGGQDHGLNYLLHASDTRIDGFRGHSEAENQQVNARFEAEVSPETAVIVSLHHTDQPVANDPGGINAQTVAMDRSAARDRNVAFNTGEELEQTRLGLTVRSQLADGHGLQARVHTVSRDFRNRLPFEAGGAVSLDRGFHGAGVQYTWEDTLAGKPNRLLIGVDYDVQDDDRSRYQNLMGQVGDKTLEQNEKVTSVGWFLQNEIRLTAQTEATWGIRQDEVVFDVTDRFLADGNDSGEVTLDHLSPMVGISHALSDRIRLYANVSSAFETPTTTEFANPSGGGGFNQALEPQKSTNYEIGLKSLSARYRYEVALFSIDVRDELINYELEQFPDRDFYENAGRSTRNGVEFSYLRKIGSGGEFSAAYTWSDFTFDRYASGNNRFDGNRIPGIPEHLLHLEFSWFIPNGLYMIWDANLAGSLFADNANAQKVDGYTVSNLRLGWEGWWGDWEVSPFLGVNNLLDEEYHSNIRINAFGGRYYEPAPGRNAYAGIRIRKQYGGQR